MLHLDTDARVALVSEEFGELKAQLLGGPAGGGSSHGGSVSAEGSGGGATAAGSAASSRRASGAAGDAAARPQLQDAVAGLLSEAQASLKQLEGRSGSGSSSRGGTPQLTPRGSSQREQPGGGAGRQQQGEQLPTVQDPAGAEGNAGSAAEGGALSPQAAASPAQLQPQQAQQAQHEGMTLVAVLLCTLLRGCRLQGHKARVVSLLCDSAAYCDDETRLQRVLPYLVAATAEPLAAVKCVALRGIARVLAQVGNRRAVAPGRVLLVVKLCCMRCAKRAPLLLCPAEELADNLRSHLPCVLATPRMPHLLPAHACM